MAVWSGGEGVEQFAHQVAAAVVEPRDDEDLANRVRELIAAEAGLTERKMLGGLAFLINGNMSVGASGQGGLMVRVDPDETDALVAKPHARPFEMRGREMRAWLRVDS